MRRNKTIKIKTQRRDKTRQNRRYKGTPTRRKKGTEKEEKTTHKEAVEKDTQARKVTLTP